LSDSGWADGTSPAVSVDLNDQLPSAKQVAGRRQRVYTAGLNWYVNCNIRVMFDYLDGNIATLRNKVPFRRVIKAHAEDNT
jgi:phosphate-selective porin